MGATEDKRRRLRAAYVTKARYLVGELDGAERVSLLALKPDLLKRSIPAAHEDKLIELGLAERKLGGLALSTVGNFAARMV